MLQYFCIKFIKCSHFRFWPSVLIFFGRARAILFIKVPAASDRVVTIHQDIQSLTLEAIEIFHLHGLTCRAKTCVFIRVAQKLVRLHRLQTQCRHKFAHVNIHAATIANPTAPVSVASAGSGIGRYLGLGLGPDAMVAADGSLDALDGYGGFIAWRHAFSPKLRGNLMYSASMFDNDKSLPGWGLASYALTERSQSIHANLIYSPLPKLDVGAEIGYGKRELEDEREGDLKRIQTTVKYSF